MKGVLTAAFVLTFFWPAQFIWALEEQHPWRHDIHSEMESSSSTERSVDRQAMQSDVGGASAEEASSGKTGTDQAVLAADPNHGFKLSVLAARTIGLLLLPIHQSGAVVLPKEAIVYSKDETGVYRFRSGWLKLVFGRVTSASDRLQFMPLKAGDLRTGDQVATGAVPIIRVTDIYVFSAQEGEGE